MNWIKDFILVLLITSITGGLMMFAWMGLVHVNRIKWNVHYVYWMLRGVLAGYLLSLIYLIFHWIMEWKRNDYDILSVSTVFINKVFMVLFFIWVGGVLYLLVSQLHTWYYYRHMKKGRMAVPVEYFELLRKLCMEMKLKYSIHLYQGYGVKSPFIIGVIHPQIYLPVKDFSMEDLEMILYHELIHYKQGDTFWKPIFGFVGNIYWFNPLSRLLWTEATRWAEVSCDTYCCQEKFEKKKYFTLLLNMGSVDSFHLSGYAPMWTEGGNELRWRINFMKGYVLKKTNIAVVIAIAVVSLLGGSISAHAATQGIKKIYQEAYLNTVEETEETLNDENELQEYEGTLDEFKGMKIIEHLDEQKNALSKVGTIDWTVNSKTIHYTTGFHISAGGKIAVAIGITQSDEIVTVGILKPDGKTSYVQGKNIISHTFSASKTGTYKVFVSNTTEAKVTVGGSYTRFCSKTNDRYEEGERNRGNK